MHRHSFDFILSRVISEFGRKDARVDLKIELNAVAALLSRVRFQTRAVEKVSVPALRHMDRAIKNAQKSVTADIASCFKGLYPQMYWSSYYSRDDAAVDLLDELAIGELISPRGPVLSTEIILGAVVLGPDTYYPPHAHKASEVYYIISGNPLFKRGGEEWTKMPAGSFCHHPDCLTHAVRSGHDPMLALYTWRGDIASPAYFV